MILEFAFGITALIAICAIAFAMNERQDADWARERLAAIEKQLIEFGMQHNQSMVHYSREARRVRQLIIKFNKLNIAVENSVLIGMDNEERLAWFKAHYIDDFRKEVTGNSRSEVVQDTIEERNKAVAPLRVHEKESTNTNTI